MKRAKWIWMPHAGHFICGHKCRFHLNTYIGKYIVSTVGEMREEINSQKFEKIGDNRLLETMVFQAKKSKYKCCPYEIKNAVNVLDFEGYNKAEDAYKGHLKLCAKWSKK